MPAHVEIFAYPRSALDERIAAMNIAMGCANPETGVAVAQLLKDAETILNYMRTGQVLTTAEVVKIGAK